MFGDGEGPRNEELDAFQILRRTEFQYWRRQQVEIAGQHQASVKAGSPIAILRRLGS